MRMKSVAVGVAALILLPLAVLHGILRASLPQLDGVVRPLGLVAPVTIERDSLGVPTLEAGNRVDLAFATGFVHGQDRFFQMDLSRRLAAGELSELFGEAALEQDRRARLFGFRHVARESLGQATPEQRAVLEAYARGVNAGISGLRSRPWEYWMLGSAPRPWMAEDSILVTHAMWWDLQYDSLRSALVRRKLNDRLGGSSCAGGWKCALQFFYPARTRWDAPNVAAGTTIPARENAAREDGDVGPVPPSEALDLKNPAAAAAAASVPASGSVIAPRERAGIGSNNWAIAGRLTNTGAALVANDMHLRSRVPTVWYRARLRIPGRDAQPPLDLAGVTLPGAPLLVAGSNGRVAWGFTNSYGTWYHLEPAHCTFIDDTTMQTPSGPVALITRNEEIRVHGRPSQTLAVRSGPAGVLFESNPQQGRCWFATWLAQLPGATNMNLMGMERVQSVAQALTLAAGIGIPHQNLVLGDSQGHIAWTIAGRIPRQLGFDRSDGHSAWMDAEAQPRIVDPEIGRVWTANARATDDPQQEAAIGAADASVGADYDLGARAQQIRDDLLAMRAAATPADMLHIQLDDRAVFLSRWRAMLLRLLDEASLAAWPQRAQFRRLLADWSGRADVDSAGYRLVRTYRDELEKAEWESVLRAVGITPDKETLVPGQFESALWRLVTERPLHLLPAPYGDWRQFLLAQLDRTIDGLIKTCGKLQRCTWGSRRPVRIRHPLSGALPFLSPMLDMRTVILPGDHDMPRVQDGPIGASERFAVSPGHEAQGYIHIAGAQSGHPLSPYYRAGFMDWAQGNPLPFLPGPSQHRLTLRPE